MRRFLLAWLLAIPLVSVGSQVAHWLAYAVAADGAASRSELLAQTGHGYLAALPILITASLGLIAATLMLVTADGYRGRAQVRLQRWPFLIVPFAGFIVQELVERGVAGHPVTLSTLVEAPVLLGLLLQVPFAALAFSVACALTRAATQIGRVLGAQRTPVARTRSSVARPALGVPPLSAFSMRATPVRGPPRTPLFAVV